MLIEGKGGRKAGIWDGGFQFAVRGRLRDGDEGFDTGERGSGGVEGRGGGVFLSSGEGERTRCESIAIASSSFSSPVIPTRTGTMSDAMSISSSSSPLSYSDTGGLPYGWNSSGMTSSRSCLSPTDN